MIFSTLNVEGDKIMVIDLLEKCRERRREIEENFYTMMAYSDYTPMLDKLCDEMIKMDVMIIRMEKQLNDRLYGTENAM